MTDAVVLLRHADGFRFCCLACPYCDEKVMRGEYAAWGRFGAHVRWTHSRPLRPGRRRRR